MSGILPETFVPGFHDEAQVRKMVYNDFGSTGLKVSKLSFGTGVFCYAYNDVSVENCRETLLKALKMGVNYIDTAPYYGHGESEEVLGKILEGIPRKAYYIATKVGRYEKDLKEQFNFSAEKTKQSIEASLQRLRLDYVDVLQVHDVEFAPSLDMVLNETLPTVQEIVKSGKARFMGVTGYPVRTLAECVQKSPVKLDMILSYARLTLFDETLKEFLPVFKKHHLAVVNAAVNGLGLLTNRGERSWHVATKQIKDVCATARQLCIQNDVELGKLAVWHSLQQEGPATTLVGMDSVEIVDYNLEVLHNGLTFKERELYQQVLGVFKTLKDRHWENHEVAKYWELMTISTK
ncbi:L-galactose dehydrogenase [Dendroctonus ponderosae]|uniref:NADP-dependent oxidoreductase domain-containing protein n=1 Tax=Dendroctonus ponderosae TaxID=77166 RepID=J3JYH4_DENPD